MKVVEEETKINVLPPTEKLLQEAYHATINDQNTLRIDFADEIEIKSNHKRSNSLGAQTQADQDTCSSNASRDRSPVSTKESFVFRV